MLFKNLVPFLVAASVFHCSCQTKTPKAYPSPALYDLNHPEVYELPEGLSEISGMAYYPKDSSVFAIIDEDGLFYKISLNGSKTIQKWKFDKKHDYEDVVLQDSTFYVLISNGDIETLRFQGDSIITSKSNLSGASKKMNEFESLYYDHDLGLVLLCKDCEEDGKKIVTAWGFSPDSSAYNPSLFAIDVKQVAEKLGVKKLELKPSAAAINPLTDELYILASINHLLLISDRKGNVKEVWQLDPHIYKQAEGITFTPAGEMLISNEAGEAGNANILIFKRKKKG